MVQRVGKAAKLSFPIHPHMLRHSTGYKLANDGHERVRWRTITLHGVSAGSLRQVLAGLKGCSENVRRLRVVYAQQSTTIDFAPIARHNRIEIMTTPTSGVRGMG